MRFYNNYFYLPRKGREMIHKTSVSNLNFFKNGIFWVNQTSGNHSTKYKSNDEEIDKILEIFKVLTTDGLNDNVSFGITSPFRNQAEKIQRRLSIETINENGNIKVLGDTIHKFQGDEKDVIFFSPVISFEATNGMKNFINYNAPQLLNVAISRGRRLALMRAGC